MIFGLTAMILLILNINGHSISEWLIFAFIGASVLWTINLYRALYNCQTTITKIKADINKSMIDIFTAIAKGKENESDDRK